MTETTRQLLLLGMAIAIFPVPIIVAIVTLRTTKSVASFGSYISGWVAGVFTISVLALRLINPQDRTLRGQPADWLGWVALIGGILVAIAAAIFLYVRLRQRPKASTPSWLQSLGGLSAIQWFGVGFAMSTFSPKNILLIVGATAIATQSSVLVSQQIIAWSIFMICSSLGIALPAIAYFAGGKKVSVWLDAIYTWLAIYSQAIMAAIVLVASLAVVAEAMTILW